MKTLLLVCVSLCVVPATLVAASRSSANYNVPADTVDAGGRRTTSAAYVVDASIGGIGGISTAPAPAETMKHSYIGQLYDARGVVVSASPTSVNEGATRQLAAAVSYDDATTQGVPPGSVGWSVVSGPINSISAGGLATAGNVYANTVATVRGDYSGQFGLLNLSVVNVNLDNYGIYAGDGADDTWQVQYFGESNPLGLGGVDADGDGQTNYFEYVATTNPTNTDSRFRLSVERVTGQPTHEAIRFSPRSPTRGYSVVGRQTVDGIGWTPVLGPITDNASERTVVDTNATANSRFYKVLITVP